MPPHLLPSTRGGPAGCGLTFAVTLGPFFFSSAEEPLGKARKITDPTMTVTATRNFILLSQSLTINEKCEQPGGRTACESG